jgi:hypothetical protein
MKGKDLVQVLAKELKLSNQALIARALSVSPALISNLSNQRRNLTTRQLAGFIKRVVNYSKRNLLRNSVETIVEYFPIEPHKNKTRWHPLSKASHPELARCLKNQLEYMYITIQRVGLYT